MAINERKGLILTIIFIGLPGILGGFFLRSDLLPSLAAHFQYDETVTKNSTVTKVIDSYAGVPLHDERITTNTTIMKVIHSRDDFPQHEHIIKVTVTTNETTPNGVFYNFAAAAELSANLTPTPSPPVPDITPTQSPNQTAAISPPPPSANLTPVAPDPQGGGDE